MTIETEKALKTEADSIAGEIRPGISNKGKLQIVRVLAELAVNAFIHNETVEDLTPEELTRVEAHILKKIKSVVR